MQSLFRHEACSFQGMNKTFGSLLLAATGGVVAYLVVRRRPTLRARRAPAPERQRPAVQAHSEATTLERKFGVDRDRDIVEESSWESFPASDPPSY